MKNISSLFWFAISLLNNVDETLFIYLVDVYFLVISFAHFINFYCLIRRALPSPLFNLVNKLLSAPGTVSAAC